MRKARTHPLLAALVALAPMAAPAGPLVTNAGSTGDSVAQITMDNALSRGRQAVAKRDFAAAERHYQEAIKGAPDSPQPLLALADSARVQGKADQSKAWLDKALAMAPRDVEVLRAVARWHFVMGQHAEAAARWQAALQIDPSHTGVLVDLADFSFNARGDTAAAAALYERALAVNPSLAGARYGLGVMQQRRNELEPALRNLQDAARLSPGNALPWMAMAQLQRQRGDRQKALHAYGAALEAQPSYYPARLERGQMWLAQEPAKALADFEEAIRQQPRSAEARVAAGMAQQLLKRPDAALASYRAALQFDPKNVIALNNAAWLASERKGMLANALQWATEAVRLAPGEPAVLCTLAWVHHRRGDSAKAAAMLQALVQATARPRAESYYLLGRVHADRSEREAASAALREALRIDASFPQAGEAGELLRRLQGG
jgi:tetratricopeptide (TPR) repeat protein